MIETSYDRTNRRYPYKSHGQYARAWYGLIGCSLLAVFNGWKAFTTPFNVQDFFASYISVSTNSEPVEASTEPAPQIVVFFLLVILYHFKNQGPNITEWRLNPTMDLSNPMRVESGRDRRGRFPKLRSGQPMKNLSRVLYWFLVWIR